MFPHVCVVARCWLATPPAQSIVERAFSCGKIVMSRLKTALGDDLFEALVVLRMNRKLHNEYDLQKGAARLKRKEKEGASKDQGAKKPKAEVSVDTTSDWAAQMKAEGTLAPKIAPKKSKKSS